MNEVIEMEKQNNRNTWAMARSRFGKRAAQVGTMVAAFGTAAVVHAADYTSEITAAQGDATTNTSAAAAAVIGIAALVMGLGIVVSLIRR